MVTEQQVRRHLNTPQNVNLTIALADPLANALEFSTLAGWLAGAFDWSRSPQGLTYWTRLCYALNIVDEQAKAVAR